MHGAQRAWSSTRGRCRAHTRTGRRSSSPQRVRFILPSPFYAQFLGHCGPFSPGQVAPKTSFKHHSGHGGRVDFVSKQPLRGARPMSLQLVIRDGETN